MNVVAGQDQRRLADEVGHDPQAMQGTVGHRPPGLRDAPRLLLAAAVLTLGGVQDGGHLGDGAGADVDLDAPAVDLPGPAVVAPAVVLVVPGHPRPLLHNHADAFPPAPLWRLRHGPSNRSTRTTHARPESSFSRACDSWPTLRQLRGRARRKGPGTRRLGPLRQGTCAVDKRLQRRLDEGMPEESPLAEKSLEVAAESADFCPEHLP